jgi:DNA-binding NtrC family response regulator
VSSRGTVLIVDDEEYVRESLGSVLARRGYAVRTAEGPEEAFDGDLGALDAVVTDLKMRGEDGLALLRRVAETQPGLPVVVLTGFGTVPSAVECMQAGAVDYLLKPVAPEHLLLVVERAIHHRRQERELTYLRKVAGRPDHRDPIGDSDAWREAMRLVDVVAPTDTPVLLLGESGTGKEEVAKLIHRRSPRSDAALVRVNCAAIPAELFESELFGHRRGAFTGATRDHDGRFRIADGGTLFLDEINSLPAPAQAKLLRVLQDGGFERVGDNRTIHVDVRLVSASNSDLPAEVEAGRFRSDLFYRINVMTVNLPPLRERREDVPRLAAAFLEEIGGRLGRPLLGISPEAEAALVAYSWPGNVRELRNVVERALLLETGDRLTPASLPFTASASAAAPSPAARDDTLNLRQTVTRVECETLREALRRAEGVKRRAAELLGIDERNLAYYLRKHGLMGDKS